MKKKLIIALFLTLIFFGTFGVKKSWATEGCGLIFTQDSLGRRTSIIGKDSAQIDIGVSCLLDGAGQPNQGECEPLKYRYRLHRPVDNKGTVVDLDFNIKPSIFSLGWYIMTGEGMAFDNPGIGSYSITFGNVDTNKTYCSFNFKVVDQPMALITPAIISIAPTGNSPFDPCKNLAAGLANAQCRACTGIDEDGNFMKKANCDRRVLGDSCGTWTSLGCIPNDPPKLVGWILGLGSGIAGGIAFLLILFGASQIVMSGGVPEKIAAGKEVITSAVIGLVFIFVSVLVLKIIGVQILGIPGWS